MDINTVIDRMKSRYYEEECEFDAEKARDLFQYEVKLIFSNCKSFNQKGSQIVRSAEKLANEFRKQMKKHGIWNE